LRSCDADTVPQRTPVAGAPLGESRLHFDAGDNQRIDAKCGNVAEKTEQRGDCRGGEAPPKPRALVTGWPDRPECE